MTFRAPPETTSSYITPPSQAWSPVGARGALAVSPQVGQDQSFSPA